MLSVPEFEAFKLKFGNCREISKNKESLLLACSTTTRLSNHSQVGAGLWQEEVDAECPCLLGFPGGTAGK